MFTIEHEFDASVVTLVDEGAAPLIEDITITIFDDEVVIEQLSARTGKTQHISFSTQQLNDLKAALNLPEGTYTLQGDP